jgi:D-alanyl-lipoteichoic acid acyltransferase DltB (MBOAT superfamily)
MSVAWVGAIAYSLQLYYDFSGYSDMAIGLARIFNIHLPVNFNSPYKSLSIIEFWARWHITLSQFLRNYLYIPLGGNRKGEPRRLINIFITMLLGGIWHGAGTQFILWGILHGFFIVVNHIWRIWKARLGITPKGNRFTCFVSWVSTMLCVVIAWVFFRADNIASALLLIKSMFDPGAAGMVFHFHDVGIKKVIFLILGLLGVGSVIFLPNTQELMAAPSNLPSPSFSKRAGIRWRPSRFTGILIGLCFFFSICILLANRIVLQTSSPFLYFKF